MAVTLTPYPLRADPKPRAVWPAHLEHLTMATSNYPPAYHAACNHLVSFGGHGGDTARGRALCAAALRALRAIDREMARREWRTLYYISGQLPVKGSAS